MAHSRSSQLWFWPTMARRTQTSWISTSWERPLPRRTPGMFQYVSCFAMSFRFSDVLMCGVDTRFVERFDTCQKDLYNIYIHTYKFEVMRYWANLWCRVHTSSEPQTQSVTKKFDEKPPVLLGHQDLVLPAANVLMDKLDVTVDHDAGRWLRLSNVVPFNIRHSNNGW